MSRQDRDLARLSREQLFDRAARPEGVSEEVVPAPARGPLRRYRPTETVMTPKGPHVRYATVHGFHAARAEDAFDRMEDQRRRRGKKDQLRLFTVGQVEVGRDYAALVERVESAGVKCSSIESLGRASGGGSWIDAVIADSRRLEVMRESIGEGLALVPKRMRSGGLRWEISVRRLVDDVCLGGRSLSDVLDSAGWGRSHKYRTSLHVELAAALDRMQGYRDRGMQNGC